MTRKNPSRALTVIFIRQVHAEQFDKQGVAYWRHPLAVADLLVRPTMAEDLAAYIVKKGFKCRYPCGASGQEAQSI